MKSNLFILTGAPGSGKSTILQELKNLDLAFVNEPAREIIAEQREINGNGLYDKNKELFTDLLLSRATHQFKQNQNSNKPVIFDRGIADNIAYAEFFELEAKHIEIAAEKYRYNQTIFFTPS